MSAIRTELLELKAAVSEIATRLDALLDTISFEAPGQSNEEPAAKSPPDEIMETATKSRARDIELTEQPISRTPPPLPAEVTGRDMPCRGDNLRLIKGIDARCHSILTLCDVRSFGDIAKFQAEDVCKLNDLLGNSNRIQRENWIEQAAMLAEGRATKFSNASACRRVQANKEKRIVSASKPSETFQSKGDIIPFPTQRALSSGDATGRFNRGPMWRSVAACLAVGALAVPLVTSRPTGDAFELRTARLWCGHQQAGLIDACYSHEFKLAYALR